MPQHPLALPVNFTEPRKVAEEINLHYARRARARADDEEQRPQAGILRASSAGYHLRRRVFPYHKTARQVGDPFTPRAIRTFEVGDHRHFALRRALRDAVPGLTPGRFDDVTALRPEDHETELDRPVVTEAGAAWLLRGHVDGLLLFPDGLTYVLELKTQNAARFDDFCNDDYGPESALGASYYGQDCAYLWLSGADGTIHVHENKDTQAIKVRVYRRIAYPHVRDVEPNASLAAAAIDSGVDPLLLPPCEGDDYGVKDDSKRSLKWGCSYCSFWKGCHPEHVKTVSGGRTAAVHASSVKADARVSGHGLHVQPSPSWQFIEV